MESHYKDSLSTAIVNILLQCGFENSSKRALDEFIGLSLNYVRNIASKISLLTNDCNLPESDTLIGLGALKLHGDNLDELFSFLENYNEIFPPQPKTYFGPIPQKSAQKTHEDKPQEIVSWAPEMSPALASIGLKLKNKQIVVDPSFDRSKFLALSSKSPTYSNEHKSHHSLSQSQKATNAAVKYGSSCSYYLPAEAYPNKYEAPTIDLDSNGAVIGLNGKSGKLPDPYINDLEEQDILRQQSKFSENHAAKLSLPNQLFNGIRRKQRSDAENSFHDSPQSRKRPPNEPSPRERSSPVVEHYQTNHNDKTTVTSDDAWTAALQAKITTVLRPDPYVANFEDHHVTSKSSTPHVSKKHKKRHRQPSESRPRKMRRLDDSREDDVSQIYQNDSTMESRVSEAVPYTSSLDRESGCTPTNHYQSVTVKERSPSYSPIEVPDPRTHHVAYYSEMLQPHSFSSVTKSKKKKSTRKTHFTNKRKKKAPQSVTASYNFQYQPGPVEHDDQSSVAHSYRPLSQLSSPVLHPDTYTDDSGDDGTEPMKESSEEMLKMLEMPVSNHDQILDIFVDSPPYPILNNRHGHHTNNAGPANSSEGGIRMKIKLFRANSDTNPASSHVTDLSSPVQSQHSDDKNSVSERLKFMRDESPVSVHERRVYDHCSFEKSPDASHYDIQRDSPSVSSTQGSYKEYCRHVNSVASGFVSSAFSQSNTPIKLIMKPMDLLRHKSASSHSSPKTLPALDDCDSKIPSLLFKTSKSAKKRKRSKVNSGTKKSKSKKSSKLKFDIEMVPIEKVVEKTFISVDDVFSDDDDNITRQDQNHHHPHHHHHTLPLSNVDTPSYLTNEQSLYHMPPILDKSSPPYRLPIPTIKINNKSLSKKCSSKSKTKSSLITSVPLKPVDEKTMYNYSCLQGESHYASEDGKVVYICPICNTEDNGSLMLQCDHCQDWYHGLCLGIFDAPPEHLEWFCPRCIEDRSSGRLNVSRTKISKNRTKKK